MIRWLRRQFIGPFRELKRPAFPVNNELQAKAQAIRIREKLGEPRPDRNWSYDANGSPLDYDTDPPPC